MVPEARIAHIGIAVENIDQSLAFYRDVLGVTPLHQPEQLDGATIVSLVLGDAEVELLQPLVAESPVGKFMAKRGPGIHHLCYHVPDLDQALERCRTFGYRLIDERPRVGQGGKRVAFVHPKSTTGILIELTE